MPKKREFHKNSEGQYWKAKKLSNGQTAMMLFTRYYNEYEVGFVIGKNRKQCMSWYVGDTKYLNGAISGKDTNVIEVYSFAKSTLKSFEKFIFKLKGRTRIRITWEEKRRGEVYTKALTRKDMGYTPVYRGLVKFAKGDD